MTDNQYFSNQTHQVLEYFEKWLYSLPTNKGGESKRTIFCALYDVFHETEINITKKDKIYHNCIGCNFEEGCLTILDFLNRYSGSFDVQSYLTIYTLLFYAEAERLGVIYRELGYVTGRDNFDWSAFPALTKIKHWANFFKHPKSYMHLHHPTYFIETDPDKPNVLLNGIVNSDFVLKYYRASADNDELADKFEKGIRYTVFFPDLLDFTKQLCKAFQEIIPIVKTEKNIEILRKYTLEDIWI